MPVHRYDPMQLPLDPDVTSNSELEGEYAVDAALQQAARFAGLQPTANCCHHRQHHPDAVLTQPGTSPKGRQGSKLSTGGNR